MTKPHTVAIVLGRVAHDSRVLVDGFDITTAVVGLDVHAHVGELTTITLTLSARVELTGDVERLRLRNPNE